MPTLQVGSRDFEILRAYDERWMEYQPLSKPTCGWCRSEPVKLAPIGQTWFDSMRRHMDIDEAYLWSEEYFDQHPDGPPGMTVNPRTGHRYIASIVPLHSDDCCRLCRDAFSGVAFYWSEDDVIAKV